MQRPRFDLRPRIQNLRDRTARLRNPQAVGSQPTPPRKTRLRAEYFVPIAAFLLLIIALVFNAYSSRLDDAAIAPDDIVLPGATATVATGTAVVAEVYPGPSATPALASGTPLATAVATLPAASAYPAPTGDLPLPVGTPIAGGLPPVIDGPVQPPVLLPTSAVVPLDPNTPPDLIAPTDESRDGVASGDEYPPPVTNPNLPNPATLPATAVIPP
ncbi:MAG TPA: hypothetical protein VLA19_27975, partial [Herpetosiphonaceae bacterium]|nr:hypothetical protein [Herpetosiphonaceae bacterium]